MRSEQITRYSRQLLLPDLGRRQQQRLMAAHVIAPVGPGCAAETTALLYLVAAGVEAYSLRGPLADPVTADEQAQQIIYRQHDLARSRVEAIRDRLAALNPEVQYRPEADAPNGLLLQAPHLAWMHYRGVAAALVSGGFCMVQAVKQLVESPDA